MRHRIIYSGLKYRPQYLFRILWLFPVWIDFNVDHAWHTLEGEEVFDSSPVEFYTLEEAEDYICTLEISE